MKGKIIAISIIVIVSLLIIWGVVNYINDTPKREAEDKAYQKQWSETMKEITDSKCDKLIKLRLESINGTVPDKYSRHWDTIRDTYNAKSCGTHWGIWED